MKSVLRGNVDGVEKSGIGEGEGAGEGGQNEASTRHAPSSPPAFASTGSLDAAVI